MLLTILFDVKTAYASCVLISPSSASITFDESVTMNSTISGGEPPYNYTWYLNGSRTAWNSSSVVFTPFLEGFFVI